MNTLNIRTTLLALTITLFAPTFGMMDSLTERVYKTYENMRVYKAGVFAIDATATIASKIILYSAYITCTQNWLEKRIDDRLAQIENQLKVAEEECITAIFNNFNIIQEAQVISKERLELFKQYEKEYMATAHEEIVNDPELIAEILPLLKILNINPQGIKIEVSSKPSPLLPLAYATEHGLKARYKISKNILTIQEIISPPIILIHPRGLKELKEHPKALLGHELGHIAAQHHATIMSIFEAIAIFAEKKPEEVLANANFKQLVTVHEQQAEILYKNAEYACAIRESRTTDYYPNQLFLGHYAQLAEIDELHKLKAKLQIT